MSLYLYFFWFRQFSIISIYFLSLDFIFFFYFQILFATLIYHNFLTFLWPFFSLLYILLSIYLFLFISFDFISINLILILFFRLNLFCFPLCWFPVFSFLWRIPYLALGVTLGITCNHVFLTSFCVRCHLRRHHSDMSCDLFILLYHKI